MNMGLDIMKLIIKSNSRRRIGVQLLTLKKEDYILDNNQIRITETTINDLENVTLLWNDGEVMKFVGFPNGLGVSQKSLEEKWLPGINKNNKRRHYSIYHDMIGYCGESYYEVEDNGKAALDIKLFAKARGKGIAYAGLQYAIEKAFAEGHAEVVYVDPQKVNEKALSLYKKFRFKEYPHPDPKEAESHYYFELSRDDYYSNE